MQGGLRKLSRWTSPRGRIQASWPGAFITDPPLFPAGLPKTRIQAHKMTPKSTASGTKIPTPRPSRPHYPASHNSSHKKLSGLSSNIAHRRTLDAGGLDKALPRFAKVPRILLLCSSGKHCTQQPGKNVLPAYYHSCAGYLPCAGPVATQKVNSGNRLQASRNGPRGPLSGCSPAPNLAAFVSPQPRA